MVKLSLMTAFVVIGLTILSPPANGQNPSAGNGQVFDVVSIRLSRTEVGTGISNRPNGFTAVGVPVMMLIAAAYPPVLPADISGLPRWARTDCYDVIASTDRVSLSASDRQEMLRALLADRFGLSVRSAKREQQTYDLVMAHPDGRLGPGIAPSNRDCDAIRAVRRGTAGAAGSKAPPPPTVPSFENRAECTIAMIGDRVEGEGTIADLTTLFRLATGRQVVDKTNLRGTFRVTMRYDARRSRNGPEVGVELPDAAPLVYTAVQEQLGMKLTPSRNEIDVLFVDQIALPTPN